jgi:hypothetical protein
MLAIVSRAAKRARSTLQLYDAWPVAVVIIHRLQHGNPSLKCDCEQVWPPQLWHWLRVSESRGSQCMELESVQLTACVVRGVSSRLLEHDEPGRTLQRLGSHGMREGSSHLTVTYTTPHNTSLTHVPWTQVLNVPNTTVKIGIIGGTGGCASVAWVACMLLRTCVLRCAAGVACCCCALLTVEIN